jgi:hypothetical protein
VGYELHRLEEALVIRWLATPTRETAVALRAELESALRAAKSPLALWIVIDADRSDLPSPDARAALQRNARELFDLARSVELVLLGEGLRASLMRTFLRTMTLVTRTRDRVHVHDDPDQAVRGRRLDPKLIAALRGSA